MLKSKKKLELVFFFSSRLRFFFLLCQTDKKKSCAHRSKMFCSKQMCSCDQKPLNVLKCQVKEQVNELIHTYGWQEKNKKNHLKQVRNSLDGMEKFVL